MVKNFKTKMNVSRGCQEFGMSLVLDYLNINSEKLVSKSYKDIFKIFEEMRIRLIDYFPGSLIDSQILFYSVFLDIVPNHSVLKNTEIRKSMNDFINKIQGFVINCQS